MDYDATNIAVAYDHGRDHGPENRNLWMDVISSHLRDQQVRTIVDVGCGTGRFSESLAIRFDANVIGIDPSKKMLAQARIKRHDSRVRYSLGRGEAIPLANDSADLIFISMVFHHFDDPGLVARECHRVLRQKGTLFLRAGTAEQIPGYPYVSFFPESRPLLEDCLSSSAAIREVFEGAGFETIAVDIVTQEIAPNYSVYAEKLAVGADSILARLTPQDFHTGLEAMRLHAERIDDQQAVIEPIDIFVFRS